MNAKDRGRARRVAHPGFGYMEFDAGGTAISLTALPQIETPVCFMVVDADPDGNKILLHQWKDGSFG